MTFRGPNSSVHDSPESATVQQTEFQNIGFVKLNQEIACMYS